MYPNTAHADGSPSVKGTRQSQHPCSFDRMTADASEQACSWTNQHQSVSSSAVLAYGLHVIWFNNQTLPRLLLFSISNKYYRGYVLA